MVYDQQIRSSTRLGIGGVIKVNKVLAVQDGAVIWSPYLWLIDQCKSFQLCKIEQPKAAIVCDT